MNKTAKTSMMTILVIAALAIGGWYLYTQSQLSGCVTEGGYTNPQTHTNCCSGLIGVYPEPLTVGAGQRCVRPTNGCTSSSQCPSNPQCIKAPCPKYWCNYDSYKANYMNVPLGECILTNDRCLNDNDCSSAQYCQQWVSGNFCLEKTCTENKPCSNGWWYCVRGKCESPVY